MFATNKITTPYSNDLFKTNELLMEIPLYRNMSDRNQELEDHVNMLKCNINYFEEANRKLLKKIEKLKSKNKSLRKGKSKPEPACEKDLPDDVVYIKQEKILAPIIVITDDEVQEPAIKMVIEETEIVKTKEDELEEEEEDELEEDDEEELEEDEEELEEDEEDANVVIVATEETEEVELEETEEVVEETEEVELEETEEVVEETEEVVEETEEVVEETEEVVEETEEVEAAEEETEEVELEETEEAAEESEESEDVYEIVINGKTYYVSNEQDSIIYAADENGDVSIEAGLYKNGKPVFH